MLYLPLPCIRQLGTLCAEKLDAVIVKRVVAGANHHAQRRPLGACEVGNSRRWHGAEQEHVHPSRVKPRQQCAFKHIARNAGVFTNQHRRALVVLREHAAYRIGQPQYKIGRKGRLPYRATNAVGSKKFALS